LKLRLKKGRCDVRMILVCCVVVLALIPVRWYPIRCIGCGGHLYRASAAELALSPPSVANPVCWGCLVRTAKLQGDDPSVRPVRTWVESQRPLNEP